MKPLNKHLMIQPLETNTFMASDRTTYQEVGVVVDEDPTIRGGLGEAGSMIGKLVYFDSWLAKKFPVKGETDKFVWFVEYKDLVAYEPLPE
jgi:hypothetical protein